MHKYYYTLIILIFDRRFHTEMNNPVDELLEALKRKDKQNDDLIEQQAQTLKLLTNIVSNNLPAPPFRNGAGLSTTTVQPLHGFGRQQNLLPPLTMNVKYELKELDSSIEELEQSAAENAPDLAKESNLERDSISGKKLKNKARSQAIKTKALFYFSSCIFIFKHLILN